MPILPCHTIQATICKILLHHTPMFGPKLRSYYYVWVMLVKRGYENLDADVVQPSQSKFPPFTYQSMLCICGPYIWTLVGFSFVVVHIYMVHVVVVFLCFGAHSLTWTCSGVSTFQVEKQELPVQDFTLKERVEWPILKVCGMAQLILQYTND